VILFSPQIKGMEMSSFLIIVAHLKPVSFHIAFLEMYEDAFCGLWLLSLNLYWKCAFAFLNHSIMK